MSADFALRVATPEDETSVSELLKASYSVLLPPSYDEAILAVALPMITRANPALLSAGTFFVAETAGGLIIGCGGWTRESPGEGNVVPELGHLRHFAIHPKWIGRTIGRSIFALCEEQARSAGVRRFECYSGLNSEGFYTALGFERIRQMAIPIGQDSKLPVVVMQRSI